MCPPATATYTLRIITSLFVSASTTASCTHFIAVSKSTISPLRTPRDGAWPTPRILIVPSGRPSPTTTQIFEVPISRPTMRSLLAISVLSEFLQRNRLAHCRRGARPRFRLGRRRFVFRQGMNRDRFHDSRLRVGIEGVIDHLYGVAAEGDRDISLHEQIHRRQVPLRIVRVNQELLEPLQLRLEIIETEGDPRVVLVRDDEA